MAAKPLLYAPNGQPLPSSYDESYLRHTFEPISRPSNVYAWDLTRIRNGRDAQMCGNFRVSSPLGQAVKTDPAIFAALLNRLAPHRGLPVDFTGPKERIRKEAVATWSQMAPAEAVADHFEHLVMLGVGVGQNVPKPREDGSRVDFCLEPWPMHSVYYEKHTNKLKAQTTDGPADIVHGDGKWVVWRLHCAEPWHWGAVKALALVWADRAFGIRDRSQNAETNAISKFIGTLPEGIAIDSPQGKAFEDMLLTLRHGRSGGIAPHGAAVDHVESVNQAWQIYRELITGDTADIARILLGQDGTITNTGGNYIKAAQLYGVRNDLVEGDLAAASEALTTGTLRPWCALNFGDVDATPRVSWLFPDPDEDARRESLAKRTDAYNKAIKEYRTNGFKVDQALANRLAQRFGVEAPELGEPPAPPAAPPPPPSQGAPAPAPSE